MREENGYNHAMKPLPAFFQLEKFGISPEDVIRMEFRCDPRAIHPDVILMPMWRASIFEQWVEPIVEVTPGMVYETAYAGRPLTILRTGVGAPLAGDAALALGCTSCARIVFAGSVGGLRAEMRIGDLILPEVSCCGDGFSRYLEDGFPGGDCLLDRQAPDEGLAKALATAVERRAGEAGVPVHRGPVFSIDSILAQFRILDHIAGPLGCIGIEMESAAVFKAARMMGIRACAVFSVSDVPVGRKSLYAGRTEEEKEYRREIRRKVLARAILEGLC